MTECKSSYWQIWNSLSHPVYLHSNIGWKIGIQILNQLVSALLSWQRKLWLYLWQLHGERRFNTNRIYDSLNVPDTSQNLNSHNIDQAPANIKNEILVLQKRKFNNPVNLDERCYNKREAQSLLEQITNMRAVKFHSTKYKNNIHHYLNLKQNDNLVVSIFTKQCGAASNNVIIILCLYWKSKKYIYIYIK